MFNRSKEHEIETPQRGVSIPDEKLTARAEKTGAMVIRAPPV
jgi:hypothetical protein